MSAVPPRPLLKHVPPGVWTALAWCAGVVLTFLMRVRLPGEWEPAMRPGAYFSHRWHGLALLLLTTAAATALALVGSCLLRRRPLPALASLLAASTVATIPLGVGEIPMAQFLAVDVALYFVTATHPRRTGVTALVLALAVLGGYLTTRLLSGWPVGTSAELAVAMTAVIACLTGHSTRQAHEYAEGLRARAAAQAVTAERLRIAREMHDTVAHSIGIIALQAGAARRVIDNRPELAREALGEIETAGRETLSGLRRMLGALRQAEPVRASRTAMPGAALDPPSSPGSDSSFAPGSDSSLAPGSGPLPGLADVDQLAATTTTAGVHVEVRWRGERRPLPPEIDISAYRIIQEAVTNVVRHAGASSCQVSVTCREEEVSIEVLDGGPGRGTASVPGRTAPGTYTGTGTCASIGTGISTGASIGADTGTGYGLAGMRERVALLHGEFSARPRPHGGFRVSARLPVPTGVR
ncbi:sensor histidine kinase [Streptomyces sp. MST-110588]|uniref:sensor histidine kinase n=1 Tax=Streptomyces sp. MST-110588 TaxID=2833628 RepID=UPI001F5CC9F0|nr:sensor histidine kinase [Streptomyces sp. MST-110588]UNO38491.1 sensor histidine kinase [Streptomyces sp. MST-110588]